MGTMRAARFAAGGFWQRLRPDTKRAFYGLAAVFSLIFLMGQASEYLSGPEQIFCLVLLPLYFAPTLSAWEREHETVAGIFCLNLLLGWTLIGWVIALSWAMSKPRIRCT